MIDIYIQWHNNTVLTKALAYSLCARKDDTLVCTSFFVTPGEHGVLSVSLVLILHISHQRVKLGLFRLACSQILREFEPTLRQNVSPSLAKTA